MFINLRGNRFGLRSIKNVIGMLKCLVISVNKFTFCGTDIKHNSIDRQVKGKGCL